MPASRASRGVAKATGSPRSRISPALGACTPEIALISVDLPAPLSPASASTSPHSRSKLTFSSACTPPKRLESPRTARIGSLIATGACEQRALALIDNDGDDDDDADRDELPERND